MTWVLRRYYNSYLKLPLKSTPGALLGETPAYPPLAPQFWGTLNCILPPKLGVGGHNLSDAQCLQEVVKAISETILAHSSEALRS